MPPYSQFLMLVDIGDYRSSSSGIPSFDENITERLGGKQVAKEETREIVERCEKDGLIHMSRNTIDEIDFMGNRDRWHCEVVGQVLKQPRLGLIFNSGFK